MDAPSIRYRTIIFPALLTTYSQLLVEYTSLLNCTEDDGAENFCTAHKHAHVFIPTHMYSTEVCTFFYSTEL